MSINLSSLAKDMDFSQEDIQHILDNLDSFSPEELSEIDSIVGELSTRETNKAACWEKQPRKRAGTRWEGETHGATTESGRREEHAHELRARSSCDST